MERSEKEILDYMNEACVKVWLTRTRPTNNPVIEKGRVTNVDRILNKYDDIPENGYDDWGCGYWNGSLGALRWVLGDEKHSLDT